MKEMAFIFLCYLILCLLHGLNQIFNYDEEED